MGFFSGFSDNHAKFADKSKTFQGDNPNEINHHLDETTHSYPGQRPGQPPPFGAFFYYYDNPWNEPTFDPHVDHRIAANNNNSYGAPPRLDRLRNIYENPNSHLYIPGPGIYSDFNAAHLDGNAATQPLFESPLHFYGATEIPIKRRDLLEQAFSVNLEAQPSFDPRGHDIAVNDPGTLRFFYNLGHEYFGQLRTRFGLPAISQLTQFSEKTDSNDLNQAPGTTGHFYPDCFSQQTELDTVVYKTNNMKLGSKGSVHGKSDTTDQRRGQGGLGKITHSKRYSTNRNNLSHDCDSSVTTTESDSKALTPLPQHSKNSIDQVATTPVDGNGHPQMQQSQPFDGSFHTPQRYHHQTEHAPPLLRTPIPIDGGFNATTTVPEISPMPSIIPMAAGPHPYPQYIPFFPMDDQQVMCIFISI